MLIVDKSTNSIVYDKFLTGIPNSAPVIGARGTTPTVGVITELATFYAYIVDSNNDLQSAYIDMTGISDRLAGDDYIELKHVSGVLYESESITVTPGWRGGIVTIVAIDRIGNMATAKLTLQATDPEGGEETGYEPPNIIYSKNNGFNFFQKEDWLNHNFDATPQYSFVLDSEDAAVVVVSKNLLNTEAINYLEVVNITTKKVVYSTDVAFARYKFTSGFYCYQAFIDIDSPQCSQPTSGTWSMCCWRTTRSHPIASPSPTRCPPGTGDPTRSCRPTRTAPTPRSPPTSGTTISVEVKIKSDAFPANSDWYGGAGDIIIRDFSGQSPVALGAGSADLWHAPVLLEGGPSIERGEDRCDDLRFRHQPHRREVRRPMVPRAEPGLHP